MICKNCGTRLDEGDKFCVNCGIPLNGKVDEQADILQQQQKLQEKIIKLQKQLDQKDSNSNVLSMLRFNRKHFYKVLEFLKNNALTLLGFYIVSILFFPVRWWIFLAYLLLIYMYALLSGKKRFSWDQRFDDWLHDDEGFTKVKEATSRAFTNVKRDSTKLNVTETNFKDEGQKDFNEKITNNVKINNSDKTVKDTQKEETVSKQSFMFNYEFMLGVIMSLIGGIMFIVSENQIKDYGNQLFSLLQSGKLDAIGYLYIWGLFIFGIGILALVGGLVKALRQVKGNGGVIFKFIGVTIGFLTAVIATYAYSNPISFGINAADAAYNEGVSLSNLHTIYGLLKLLPWIITFIYCLGILKNGVSKNNH